MRVKLPQINNFFKKIDNNQNNNSNSVKYPKKSDVMVIKNVPIEHDVYDVVLCKKEPQDSDFVDANFYIDDFDFDVNNEDSPYFYSDPEGF